MTATPWEDGGMTENSDMSEVARRVEAAEKRVDEQVRRFNEAIERRYGERKYYPFVARRGEAHYHQEYVDAGWPADAVALRMLWYAGDRGVFLDARKALQVIESSTEPFESGEEARLAFRRAHLPHVEIEAGSSYMKCPVVVLQYRVSGTTGHYWDDDGYKNEKPPE